MTEPLILVHGGAGDVPAALRPRHREGCLLAARRGGAVLAAGGSAVEAACAAVEALEDDEVYNAGTGCALDRDGRAALDAAVMDGATRKIGAVAALPAFKNPVRIAQRLLAAPEVLLVAEDAARWAESQGFRRLPNESMVVEGSRRALERALASGGACNWAGGTVGAVARDRQARLAAATSTGGTMGKTPGRVGDAPLCGAGTYADARCAVSATGEGEAFIRGVFAARLADALAAGQDPQTALDAGLKRLERDFGGLGGAILIQRDGGPHAGRTTPGMAHAWWSPAGDGAAD
ncbi:MAG: hypothetical protein EYC70_08195 [Planctomycetota bacterium]|nr:MAG: hypothetical protein EYC70_08195 [Planctomycetota bacterium]